MIEWLQCLLRGNHDPRRAGPLGGFKCSLCGMKGEDLDIFDPSVAQGYVSPMRRLFSRKNGYSEFTRTTSWREER